VEIGTVNRGKYIFPNKPEFDVKTLEALFRVPVKYVQSIVPAK
jgi:hypothetical protein